MKQSIWMGILCKSMALLALPASAWAQDGGDQFLDGIGETALVSRHLFRGNERDSSRNAQHATLVGEGGSYVRDARFGRVLSLPGGDGAHVQVPGAVLDGLDTVSVSGWFHLKSSAPGRLFDFGINTASNFFCEVIEAEGTVSYRVGLTTSRAGDGSAWVTLPGPVHQWVHLAVVLDAVNKTLQGYVDGVKAGEASNVNLAAEHVLHPTDGHLNRVFIGRSQDDAAPPLNTLVHDFRIYSVALTESQVTVIHHHALAGSESVVAATQHMERPSHGSGIAQPMASALVGVADVSVDTALGHLPRLPYWLPGSYRGGVQGPAVRVVWPAPTNNAPVLTTGVYTITGTVPGTDLRPQATVTVRSLAPQAETPARQLEPFPLDCVSLLPDEQGRPTPFIKNRDKFLRGLAATDPDRFLYMFRDAFGRPQPAGAQPLEVWDSQTTRLRGHATGHYLTAIAQSYASTACDPTLQKAFRTRMDYLIETLHDLAQSSGSPTPSDAPFNADPVAVPFGPGKTGFDSDLSTHGIRTDFWNWGRGYISAYPPDQFIMLEQGATYGGGNHQVWAPYYTLHKILAGLLDCYEVGGDARALAVAQGMARWVHARLKAVAAETRISMWNRYIAGEYGGMNEVLARLSRLTSNAEFMAAAKLFDNTSLFFGDADHSHGLARNVDTIRGKHANQHIPQILGALETYRGTGEAEYWRVADHFWDMCTHSYLYTIGGVAGARNPNNAECFIAEPDTLFANGFASGGQNETCATYNLLKLSRQMFLFDPDAKYMDYYEQALYNQILASVAEHDAGNTYHVPLNPGVRKQFGNARMDGFTCCNGTAIESHTKLQNSIYFHRADQRALYVNLFLPSRVRWAARNVTLTQRTDFPYANTTRLTVTGGGAFEIKVRVPRWATPGFAVKVNGRPQALAAVPGQYLTLGTSWEDGDSIEIELPFTFHLSPVMDQPNLASLFYGPVLLAAQEPGPRSTWHPITLNAEDPGTSITGDRRTLEFRVGHTVFKPFYESYGRHSVYLDVKLE